MSAQDLKYVRLVSIAPGKLCLADAEVRKRDKFWVMFLNVFHVFRLAAIDVDCSSKECGYNDKN